MLQQVVGSNLQGSGKGQEGQDGSQGQEAHATISHNSDY